MSERPPIEKQGIILAADLLRFSAYVKEHGDLPTIALLDRFYRACEAAILPAGEIFKFIGDGVLARFPEESAGLAQEAAQKLSQFGDLPAAIGLHFGSYWEAAIGLKGAPDIFGETVNRAFMLPKQEGIWASADFFSKLSDDKRVGWKSNGDDVFVLATASP
ncbi:MAG: adenylate/guanylate cyclase domain-containing protein [Planctomycetes bacterium]|nr:adenylate/guanylate cyclase domain-containing protein [Planctomycetota bacterium]